MVVARCTVALLVLSSHELFSWTIKSVSISDYHCCKVLLVAPIGRPPPPPSVCFHNLVKCRVRSGEISVGMQLSKLLYITPRSTHTISGIRSYERIYHVATMR